MKKTTFAGIVSACMVPALFWSTEGSAIPSWARKYQVSCYMCHSGMPQRNAVGEAFKNNGYRMPANAEEAFTKQKNIKIGTADWAKGVAAPVEGSFPQFDPLSVVLTGNIASYKEASYTPAGVLSKKEELNYNAPNTAALFFGATIGDNISIFGEVLGFGSSTTEVDKDVDKDASTTTTINGSVDTQVQCNVRAVYQFSPGFNLALGNNFSNASWNGVSVGGVVNVSGVLPAPGTYAEINYTKGETGGFSITAGASMAAKTTTPIVATKNKLDDILYLRGKVKLFGAGLLSGANGEFGNKYNGLDNQVTLGAGLSYSKNYYTEPADAATGITPTTGFTGGYAGETLVYGGDVQGVYNDFLVGAAYSRDRDLKLNNVKIEAGYYIYPWLFAKVAYSDLAASSKKGTYDEHQPTIAPALAWYIAPNVSLTSTYTIFTKERATNAYTGNTNQNTFALAVRAGF
jgi:hypothetical protein